MNPVTVEFLSNIIDYAGLFPPAGLPMPAAVANYASYLQSEHRALLGRFIVPVARLAEFEQAAAGQNGLWRLSVLMGPDPEADLHRIAAFNQKYEGSAIIDTLELKAAAPDEIIATCRSIPADFIPYFEIPIEPDSAELLEAISENGAHAKVRTGGVTAETFPSTASVARFLVACADADVPFKATAGLHHPIRSVHRLTYEPDSPTSIMHGFLNVFIAAAFAQNGIEEVELIEVLEETSPEAFRFDSGGITWRGHDAVRAHLRNTRNLFAMSFGSCSFEEPIADLKKLGLL
jgi:hypothetical protein